MKIAYIGGGSFRVLPEIRSLLTFEGLMDGAEIELYDLDPERVKAMAAMILKAPGAKEAGLRVRCPESVEEAIEGADFVELTACPWSGKAFAESGRFSEELGFLSSDNLSLNGAFLALRSATLALDIARKMERLAPKGVFIAFTNPVAILSAVVNRGTSIPAFGVCAGVSNYIHNVAYIMGWPEYRWDLFGEAAGINHMGWVMKLELNGRDFIPELTAQLEAGIDYESLKRIGNYETLRKEFPRLTYVYRELGALHLTIEPEGMALTAFYDEELENHRERARMAAVHAPAAPATQGRQSPSRLEAFIHESKSELPAAFWNDHYRPGPLRSQPGATIIKGMSSDAPELLEASLFNQGSIAGFPDDAVMEFPVEFRRQGIRRKTGYRLPPVVHSLTGTLVEHQTLVARAIVEEDRQLFKQAIHAFPVCRGYGRVEKFLQGMIEINRAELPAFMTR